MVSTARSRSGALSTSRRKRPPRCSPSWSIEWPDPGAGQRLDRHLGRLRARLRPRRATGTAPAGRRCRGPAAPAGASATRSASRSGAISRPEKPTNAGQRRRAAQADKQRHHRALREADQRRARSRRGRASCSASSINASSIGAAARTPASTRRRAAVLDAEPLIAVRRHVARKGRVGRDELGLGQQPRPIRREPDQIVAVGAEAVQQDHQAVRLAAGERRVATGRTESSASEARLSAERAHLSERHSRSTDVIVTGRVLGNRLGFRVK